MMKTITGITAIIGIFLFSQISLTEGKKENIETVFNALKWYGHSSFSIELDKIVYIDPLNIPESAPKADLILVTHPHFDHLSTKDINHLKKGDTVIICSSGCSSKLSGQVKEILPGEEIEVMGIKVKGVPAYNQKKSFHPKINNWLGYIITINEVNLYHAGDTDFIPEMRNLEEINIALLPVGGTYTMNAEEAAQAANTIRADISIPMHYAGGIIGTENDARKFKELCKGEARIMKKAE